MASLRIAQEKDEAIGPAIKALKDGCWPSEASLNPKVASLKREAGKLSMKDGLLYRYSQRSSGETIGQMVLPKEFREMVMKAMHDDLGHLGQERTVDLLRSRFFWPRMFLDVEENIKNCGVCHSQDASTKSCSIAPDH